MREIDLTAPSLADLSSTLAGRSIALVGDLLPVALVLCDLRGHASYANSLWSEITDQYERSWMGQRWLEALCPDHDGQRQALLEDMERGRTHQADWEVGLPGVESRTLRLAARPLREVDGSVAGFVVVATDVTAERMTMQRLAHRATHDSLTGLLNRAQFLEFVGHAFDRLRRDATGLLGVLFVDVDGLKMTNDALGHSAGDDVLRATARALESSVRPSDVVARYGGDEFIVLCEDLRDADEALAIAHRIQDAARVEGNGNSLPLSVGVAVADGADGDIESVIGAADIAMYRAKNLGTGQPVLHAGLACPSRSSRYS